MTICPPPKQQGDPTHRVSALRSGKKGKTRTGKKTGVEIRFYKRHEWEKLTKEEQNEVREYRKEALKRKAETDGKLDNAKKIAVLESMLEEQSQKIASLTSSLNKDERNSKGALKAPPGFSQRK